MQEDAALGDLYRSGREAFRPTAEQEQKIWDTLPGAPESDRQRIIDEALWAALQYFDVAAAAVARAEKPGPEAGTVRNALAAAEKTGAKFLSSLMDLARAQQALDPGSLYSVHFLGGPAVTCDPVRDKVEEFIAEAAAVRDRIIRRKPGPQGDRPLRWLVERLTSVWERATATKATRYRYGGPGVIEFVESVVAVAGFTVTEGQIDYFLREVLAERRPPKT